MEKMTNAKAIAYVIENCEIPSEVLEKLSNIKASIEKKSSGERKPTANQKENIGFKDVILGAMAEGTQYTISEIMKFKGLGELSNQRVSAIVRQLKEEGKVVRTEDKRKAYFSLA